MLLREVYQRTPDFEERVAGARFRTYEWQFLANLDGVAPVADILRRLNIDPAAISEFILEQERNGSIAPRLVSFEEFLSSTDTPAAAASSAAGAATEAKPTNVPPPYRGPVRRSPGEELRAIARLSIAAAMGEVLSLISKRRGATGAGSPPVSPRASAAPATPPPFAKPAPAASTPAATAPAKPGSSESPPSDVAASGVTAFGVSASDAQSSVAPPGETVAPTVDESPAPFVEFPRYDSPPAGSRTRDELAGFQVFDWTLPVAPPPPPEPPSADVRDENDGLYAEYPFNASTSAEIEDALRSDPPDVDVEYLETHVEETASFDETPGIAERLLRDFGPVSGHDAPLSEPVGESFGVSYSEPPPATHYESSAAANNDWFASPRDESRAENPFDVPAAGQYDSAPPAGFDHQIADESSTLPSYRDPSAPGQDGATPTYSLEAEPPYRHEAEPPYRHEAEPPAYAGTHSTDLSSAPRYEEPAAPAAYDDALSASRYGEPPPVPYYEPPTSPSFELAATYEPYYEPPAPPSSTAFTTDAAPAESAAPPAATPAYEAAPPSPYGSAAPSTYEAATPSTYEAAAPSTYDVAPAQPYEAAPPTSYIEQYADTQRVAFSVNDMDGHTERIEAPPAPQAEPVSAATPADDLEPKIDTTLTDPIVFSLSARNPDSFWSGKK